MDEFLKTVVALFKDVTGTGPAQPGTRPYPRPPAILTGAVDRLEELMQFTVSLGANGMDRWLQRFRAIFGDQQLRETLVIRVLQIKLPRVAEALALARAITVDWGPGAWDDATSVPQSFGIDWTALKKVMSNEVGEHAKARLLASITTLDDLKAAQVLMLLLLSGPDELVALEYRRKGFLSLPFSPVPGVDLRELLDLVNSPVTVPYPLPALKPGELPPVVLGASLSQLIPFGLDPAGLAKIAEQSPADRPSWGGLTLVAPDVLDPARKLDGFGVEIHHLATGAVKKTVDLGARWSLVIDARASTGGGPDPALIGRIVFAGDKIDVSAAPPAAELTVSLTRLPTPGNENALQFGDPKGTSFTVRQLSAGIRLAAEKGRPAFGYVLRAEPVSFQVSTAILKTIAMGLPIPVTLAFSSAVEAMFQQGRGLVDAVNGAPGFATQFSKHLGLAIGSPSAGLWVDDLLTRIELVPGDGRLAARVILRFDARAALGPVRVTMTGAGVWIGPWTGGVAGVVPPDGIGIVLKAGPVDGGGFLKQYGPGKFGGALQIKVLGIGVKAYGLYEELPDAVSIAAVLGIRLPFPGIQLGFGFAVSGIGGLVGINRRVDLDAMRARLQSGGAGDVLFASDPVRDAPRLLGDMDAILPAARGSFVFGPTMQLDWSKLLYLDVGLFLELPTAKFFIAGSARLIIGVEEFALVRLRLDFVGGVDPTASLIFFDGALVDSSVLGIIRITGGIALRLGYGSNPYFLYSVGGFHPSFNPGDMPVPALARAGASVSIGILWFTQQAYLAITSNTLQFGSLTEAGVKIGPIRVHGWFGFDALIQYRPFWFEATVDAGMAASFDGWEFASIRVRGRLSGPGPLVLSASASVRVLVKISKNVTITIDDNPSEALPDIPDVAALIAPEARNDANVRADGNDDEVVFSNADGIGARLVPTGALIWEQKRAPLQLGLQRVEGRDLSGWHEVRVGVEGGLPVTPEHDLFARGTFQKLQGADALSAPTFATHQSGLRLSAAVPAAPAGRTSASVPRTIVRLPDRTRIPGAAARFGSAVSGLMVERVDGARVGRQAPVVRLAAEESWAVAHPGGEPPTVGLSAAVAHTEALRYGGAVIAPGAETISLDGIL